MNEVANSFSFSMYFCDCRTNHGYWCENFALDTMMLEGFYFFVFDIL